MARMGLGTAQPGEVGEGDDEFDQYRKRMMLAYRFRPNPMVCQIFKQFGLNIIKSSNMQCVPQAVSYGKN